MTATLLSRKDFLKLIGYAAVAAGTSGLWALSKADETPNRITEVAPGSPFRVDVHHHHLPVEYLRSLASVGINGFAKRSFPQWSRVGQLEMMEQTGIRAAIMSVGAPGVHFGDDASADNLARRLNDYSAELVSGDPDRFGYFATLPMPAVEQSTVEAVRALDDLGADGIVLLASANGEYLGHPRFDELMAELNSRRATIFIHPTIPPAEAQLGLDFSGAVVEFVFDTTRALLNLIYNGVFERYPDLNWIVSHAGGTMPYVTYRVAIIEQNPVVRERSPQGALTYLKKLYYDTALSPTAPTMIALKEFAGTGQILFGSDYCWLPTRIVKKEIADLNALSVFNERELAAIQSENSLRLFPRFLQSS